MICVEVREKNFHSSALDVEIIITAEWSGIMANTFQFKLYAEDNLMFFCKTPADDLKRKYIEIYLRNLIQLKCGILRV